MNLILAGTIFAVVMSAGILVLLGIGRRIGVRQLAEEGETASKGLGAIEGAIFGLLGLILAFSFSGALSRFDSRRHLVVEEANDMSTAWLRSLCSGLTLSHICAGKRCRPGACRSAQDHELARTISLRFY